MNEMKTTFRAHSQIDKVFTTMMQQATISKTSLETGNMLGDGHSVIPEGWGKVRFYTQSLFF